MTRRLLLLNGLAVLMVPFHHAAAYAFSAMIQWTNAYRDVTVPNYDQIGSVTYYILLVIRQVDSFAIPVFLFVSGFFVAFLARGKEGTVKWSMVMPRIKVLLIPWIIWTIVRYVLLLRFPASLNDILRPYYYVVLMFQFYLLSPFIVPLAKKNWKLLLIIAGFLHFGSEGIRYLAKLGVEFSGQDTLMHLTPHWLFVRRIFYFSVGVVSGSHVKPLGEWLARVKWALLTILLASLLLSVVEYLWADSITDKWIGAAFEGVSRTIYALVFPFCFLAFDKLSIPYTKQLTTLSPKSYGIYLMNIPVVYTLSSLIHKFAPQVLGYQLLFFLILVVLGLVIPLLVMKYMSKYPITRKYYRFLFG